SEEIPKDEFDPFSGNFELPHIPVPKILIPHFKAIYDIYLKPGAEFELNLSQRILERITQYMNPSRNILKRNKSTKLRVNRRLFAKKNEKSSRFSFKNDSQTNSIVSIPKTTRSIDQHECVSDSPIEINRNSKWSFALEMDIEKQKNFENLSAIEKRISDVQSIGKDAGTSSVDSEISQKVDLEMKVDLFDEAFREVMGMLYSNTFKSWVAEKARK
ncbi:hypothetical protein HK096_001913, partial [Nowakowskiella sp. JEL0078]